MSVNRALGAMMPVYVFLGIFSLSSFGFPGTNKLCIEFLVLLAAFSKYPLVGALAIVGAILAAAYMLRLLQSMVGLILMAMVTIMITAKGTATF